MAVVRKNYIKCTKCGQSAPLKIKPIYDSNFKKTGEIYICAFCGKEYEKDKIPYVEEKKPEVSGDSIVKRCDNCEFFVRNIFQQKCLKHNKDVQVYDYCDDFEPKKKKKKRDMGLF